MQIGYTDMLTKKIMENAFKEWGYQNFHGNFFFLEKNDFSYSNGEGKWYLIVGHAFILNVLTNDNTFMEFKREIKIIRNFSQFSLTGFIFDYFSSRFLFWSGKHFPRLIIKDFSCHILQFYLQLIYFIGWQWCVFHCCLFSIIPSHT